MIRIAGLIVLVLVVIGGAVFLLGRRLPIAHTATRSVVVRAQPSIAFARIADVRRAATWRSGLQSVEVLREHAEGWPAEFREHGADGIIAYEVIERAPDRRLVTRIADRSLPFGGRWIYELRAVDGGTEVRITEDGEIYNPVFRFVSRYVLGYTRTMDRYLTDLVASFEPK